MIRSVLEGGGVALHIKPSVIEKSISLEDAIQQQVTSDYAKLFINVKDIQTLFRDGLVIIDDINKSDNATALLDKIISWNQVKQVGAVSVLCPVWPRNLAALDNKAKKVHKFTVISLKRLSFYDCKAIIQQRLDSNLLQLTEQQMHSLIVDTGFDPLLLDFSLHQLSETQHYTESIASEAIKSFVADKIQQVHNLHQSPVHLVRQSLVFLGKKMLKSRKLDPHLTDIEKWLGRVSEEYRMIVIIAAQRKLFYFDDDGKCFFRHDRVRDYLLMLAAADLFGDFAANEDVLTDPYYAEITSAALATIAVQKSTLEILIQSNPLAVYLSLKYLQGDSSEFKAAIVIKIIQAWNTSLAIKRVPKAITSAIANALMGYDVKQIERITQGFPDSPELQLAKFRNGIWLSGVRFFSFIDYFYPEAPTYWWNSILAHVQAKHLEQTIEGLCSCLPERFTPDTIAHAYTLVGFLREPRLLEALSVSWRKYANPQNYVAYLWAILNSFTKDDQQIVINALSYWSTIPAEAKSRPLYERLAGRDIKEQLMVLNWNFSEEQSALLFELCSNIALQEIFALLFTNIDHPVALSVVLNQEMHRDETRPWHDRWDDRWDLSKTRLKLSKSSLDYLLKEFSNPAANPVRRYLAWRYWTGNVDSNIALQQLQSIVSEKDSLFDDAVLWRVKHHDLTALTALKQCITSKPWLVRALNHIWNEEAKVFFEDWFIQHLDKRDLGFGLELLALLDNEDACHLLTNYWEQIKWHYRAIGTALFLSTQVTKTLADKEIRRLGFNSDHPMDYKGNIRGVYFSEKDGLSKEKEADLSLLAKQFDHLYMHYGNKYEGKGERLTREKLESLLPYLPLFDSLSINQFANSSLRIGASDLCYEKFYPLLENHLRKRIRLTIEDLKRDIIGKFRELERDDKVHISHWIKDAEKLGVTNEMLTEALQSFCEEYHNVDAFFIISLILEHLGTRKGIAIMDHFLLDSEEQRSNVEYWKANAEFLIKRRSLY